jgi:hypothetical protein
MPFYQKSRAENGQLDEPKKWANNPQNLRDDF